MPGIFEFLDSIPADVTLETPIEWAHLDFALWKLRTIARFVRAYDGGKDPEWKERLEKRAGFADPVPKGSLIFYLELNTWDALNCAELLCSQVDQGIFSSDICEAICQGHFSIQILQEKILSERRVDVEIRFSNYAYGNAAARHEITPKWTFTPFCSRSLRNRLWNWIRAQPDVADARKETGWRVSCLARPYRKVKAHVCFEDWYGEVKVEDHHARSRIERRIESNATGMVWPRRMMELSKLVLGLAIPILGLLSGAREKLLTMDVSAALATVFILGFGADTIKNALTRGTVSIPSPMPPPSPALPEPQAAPPAPQVPNPVIRGLKGARST